MPIIWSDYKFLIFKAIHYGDSSLISESSWINSRHVILLVLQRPNSSDINHTVYKIPLGRVVEDEANLQRSHIPQNGR